MIQAALNECLGNGSRCAASIVAALLATSKSSTSPAADQPESAQTFAQHGLFTAVEGLILRFADGAECRVTISRIR